LNTQNQIFIFVSSKTRSSSKVFQNLRSPGVFQKFSTEVLLACPVCLDSVGVGDGVQLRACDHVVCENCIKMQLNVAFQEGKNLDAFVCPYVEPVSCGKSLDHRELRQLLGSDRFDKLTERSVDKAVQQCKDLYACHATPGKLAHLLSAEVK
jgi:hypothetical protein